MSFEQIVTAETKKTLYPERAFLRVNDEIERLKKIESGETKTLKLEEDERENVLSYEENMAKKLKDIYDIKINSALFYPEYFLTSEGKEEFKNNIGFEIEGKTLNDVNLFLLTNRNKISKMDSTKLSELVGKSRIFNDKNILDLLKQKINSEGELSIDGLPNPQRTYLILNPEDALEKIQKLRKFKRGIAIKNSDSANGTAHASNLDFAKEKVRSLYRKRVNTMIVDGADSGAWASQIGELLDESELSQAERKLKDMFPAMKSFERTCARYDSFVYGTEAEYDNNGNKKQVGNELEKYINTIEERYAAGKLEKEKRIRDKGLDPEKLSKEDIDCETFSSLANELLDFYGERSVFPSSGYDRNRSGPAEDGKWQFIARGEYANMAVNGKQRIIKSGTENKPITEVLGTLLGHEFTHFIQMLNRSKIPLKLFQEIRGDRANIFSEGGAMMVEDIITNELFGYRTSPHPHYARAMKKRLEGGTYLDCVKAFYDSELKISKKKKDLKLIDEKQYLKEIEQGLKLAIDRTKRIFNSNEKFDSTGSFLTKSEDTVYAEQVIVMEKLKENGMGKYAFISGINLNSLADIAEMGLLDIKDIKEPDLNPIRKIWEGERKKYLSEGAKSDDDVNKIRKNTE